MALPLRFQRFAKKGNIDHNLWPAGLVSLPMMVIEFSSIRSEVSRSGARIRFLGGGEKPLASSLPFW